MLRDPRRGRRESGSTAGAAGEVGEVLGEVIPAFLKRNGEPGADFRLLITERVYWG